MEASIALLQRAVEIDPLFYQAFNNLGSQLLKSGRAQEAVVTFEQALNLVPGSWRVSANLAFALLFAGRPNEAEQLARSLQGRPHEGKEADYALGLALLAQNKNRADAIKSLRSASSQFPSARFGLAQALNRQGDVAGARHEIEQAMALPLPAKEIATARMLLKQFAGPTGK